MQNEIDYKKLAILVHAVSESTIGLAQARIQIEERLRAELHNFEHALHFYRRLVHRETSRFRRIMIDVLTEWAYDDTSQEEQSKLMGAARVLQTWEKTYPFGDQDRAQAAIREVVGMLSSLEKTTYVEQESLRILKGALIDE